MNIKFLKKTRSGSELLIIPVFETEDIVLPVCPFLDDNARNFLSKALKKQNSFKAKLGSTSGFYVPDEQDTQKVVVLGLGKAEDLNELKLQETGGKLFAALKSENCSHISLIIDNSLKNNSFTSDSLSAHICYGLKLRSYNFEIYKTKKKDDQKRVETLDVIIDTHSKAEAVFKTLDDITEGVFSARDFVNEPPNTLYPESFAKSIKDQLKPLGVEIEILDEKKMQKMGMGAILAVGMGSDNPPRMVIMRWNGGKKTEAPLMLVGKGVTFDTGGISIKPGAGMEDMKMDMGGAAAVVGTMKAIAARKAKTNVIGIAGLAENMPSGKAYRPADIIKSYSGKTIEVLNTDAEGRLVLADCLTYGQEIVKPSAIIDLATLTGAMMVALGHEYCGSFVNDNDLWSKLENASAKTGEKLWRMPLDEVWKKDMEGSFGDIQNLGKSGRWGGACTAAGFLEHFINEGTPWAHLDIAGTAWIKSDKPTVPKFGTGFGVRVLNQLINDYYE